MGYRPSTGVGVPSFSAVSDIQALQSQRDLLEKQIQSLQESLKNIEKRLSEIQKEE